jgi:broad specificity phosphatase PhoE
MYLIRHAQSAHNVDLDTAPSLRHAGPLGSDLTPRGVQEAHSLARRLRHLPIQGVYSSNLLRATHTAAILAAPHRLAVISTDLLREHDLGVLHRQTDTKRILRAYARSARLQRGRSDQDKLRVRLTADMETEEEAAGRMASFLREVARSHPGETLLVVSHFAIMRAFLVQLGFAAMQPSSTDQSQMQPTCAYAPRAEPLLSKTPTAFTSPRADSSHPSHHCQSPL